MKTFRCEAAYILSAICFSAWAQTPQIDYRPFSEEGKTWETHVGIILENIYGNVIDGDTLINGEVWKKVYNYVESTLNNNYYAAIRDEGKRVFGIAKGSNRPRLLYDFGLQKGDKVKCGVEGTAFGCLLNNREYPDTLLGFPLVAYLLVERTDTLEVRGKKFRRIILSRLDAYGCYFLTGLRNDELKPIIGDVIWVEGIGSCAGPFSPWVPSPIEGTMLDCYVDDTFIFGSENFYDEKFPASVSNVYDAYYQDNIIYDLQGRRLSAPPARGMYIQDKRVKSRE